MKKIEKAIEFMDFLNALDEEIEKSSPEYPEQIKTLFFVAWGHTFPSTSIARFLENYKQVRQQFSDQVRYEAAKTFGKVLRRIKEGRS